MFYILHMRVPLGIVCVLGDCMMYLPFGGLTHIQVVFLCCIVRVSLATASKKKIVGETQSKNAESTFSQSQSHIDCSSRD
jgi:hypothetical protein